MMKTQNQRDKININEHEDYTEKCGLSDTVGLLFLHLNALINKYIQ